jgi:hypothetical protein
MSPIAAKIIEDVTNSPRHFAELVDLYRAVPWREFLKAWGEVRAMDVLRRDEDGHYLISAVPGDAKLP